ncbi:MAG: hypothetical protein K6T86_02225 [Pirellulales bacterium]|nr:hypothetical protein [Pirellulales bacterium]
MTGPITQEGLARRSVLRSGGAALAAGLLPLRTWGHELPRRPKVAALVTTFYHRSHAHVILENFLLPYLFNGQRVDPGCDVVSLYVDQFHKEDLARDAARRFHIRLCGTIAEALTLGSDALAVDAVLSIAEHGDYPTNELGQIEYPRKRFFDEIVAVFRASGRAVPVFNDKHLSYRWDWAREMYDTARELGIPFMAGSSVPLAERQPPLELEAGWRVAEAVSIHGGPLEIYDFHALEVAQSLVESRAGGETGVRRVSWFEGDALWQALQAGTLPEALLLTAFAPELRDDLPTPSLRAVAEMLTENESADQAPHAILVEYLDGLKVTVLACGKRSTRWNFACKLAETGQTLATRFYVGPWKNRNLFKALAHAIQAHFRQGRTPYPVERTLLTTGVLAAAMEARHSRRVVETPHLAVAYPPQDFSAYREMGASWKLLTEDTPEPQGIPDRPVP